MRLLPSMHVFGVGNCIVKFVGCGNANTTPEYSFSNFVELFSTYVKILSLEHSHW